MHENKKSYKIVKIIIHNGLNKKVKFNQSQEYITYSERIFIVSKKRLERIALWAEPPKPHPQRCHWHIYHHQLCWWLRIPSLLTSISMSIVFDRSSSLHPLSTQSWWICLCWPAKHWSIHVWQPREKLCLWVHIYFYSSDHKIIFILFEWFVRWEASDRRAAAFRLLLPGLVQNSI